jgi:anti-sigma B factor antagonist
MCVCSVVIVADVSEEFGVTVTWQAADATIVVSGELDLATCPQLAASLDGVIELGTGDVLLDLGGVTFLDSTALTVLVTFRHKLAGTDRRMVLHEPSSVVVRVLAISGLLDTFAITSSDT